MQRLWPLRVVTLIPAVAAYCVRHAGQLFLLVWFPCLLVLACQLALDWLFLGGPPEWLWSENFNLRTWLTAVVVTPGGAMAWAFVLTHMADRNSTRGLVTAPLGRRAQARFELSRAVVLAAAIFTAVNLLDGGIRLAQFKLLGGLDLAFELSDAGTVIVDGLFDAIRIPAMAAVTAWAYLVAGHLLRSGTFDIPHVRARIRGKQQRLIVLFLLLSLSVIALDRLAAPAIGWLSRSADPPEWGAAMISHLADFPFFVWWTVAYAVTVGFVLDLLERREPPINAERRASQPR